MSDVERLWASLENTNGNGHCTTDDLLTSIAVSMKRIADRMDESHRNMEALPTMIEQAIWKGLQK